MWGVVVLECEINAQRLAGRREVEQEIGEIVARGSFQDRKFHAHLAIIRWSRLVPVQREFRTTGTWENDGPRHLEVVSLGKGVNPALEDDLRVVATPHVVAVRISRQCAVLVDGDRRVRERLAEEGHLVALDVPTVGPDVPRIVGQPVRQRAAVRRRVIDVRHAVAVGVRVGALAAFLSRASREQHRGHQDARQEGATFHHGGKLRSPRIKHY